MARPPHVRIRMCGAFAAFVGDTELTPTELGSRRGRVLLQMLCAARGALVRSDALVAELWPGQPPDQPESAIAVLVSRLRRVLGPESILGGRGSYRLGVPPAVELDLATVEGMLAEARTRLPGAPSLAVSTGVRALELLGVEALAEQPSAPWAAPVHSTHARLLRECRHVVATAALATGEVTTALAAARPAAEAEELDERAHRDLMAAWLAQGETAEALAVYAQLRDRLADELGVDPSEATQQVYLAALRSDPVASDPDGTGSARSDPPRLPGRAAELHRLEVAWEDAVGRDPRLVLLVGESGIGKTRLAQAVTDIANRTGGQVLAARCYESARSLFLQPVVDALGPVLARQPAPVLADLLDERTDALAELFPALTGSAERMRGSGAQRRRRTFDALVEVTIGLARRAPVLLVLDDLHDAGGSTTEWLEHLMRHAGDARLLVVGTVRIEHQDRVRTLAPLAERLELGPLDAGAVGQLAGDAGVAHLTEELVRRTSGHPLYVVELLRAAAADSAHVPEDLRSAVRDRVLRLGPDQVGLLRGAALLGTAVDPDLLGRLLDRELGWTTTACETALAARLLAVAGPRYEFSHDLVREMLYSETPEPTRVALHRRAATLLIGQPELVARHASAAGDHAQAARAGVQAAQDALRRLTPSDADVLATQALISAEAAGEPDLCGRALLVRAVARERATAFSDAEADLERAATAARASGDRRLEMHVLRHLGGDIPCALGEPVDDYVVPLHEALALATSLGDRAMEVELLGRLAILDVGRLRFAPALELARRAAQVAAQTREDDVRATALDGLKTVFAYLGETDELEATLAELEPLERRAADPWHLPWTVFESAFVPLARGDHDAAGDRFDEAIGLCHRFGYPGYVPWFLTHRAWAARLAGDLDQALDDGARAVELASETDHPWWVSSAFAAHATTVMASGDAGAAVPLLRQALPYAESSGAAGYILRVMAPLAEATASPTDLTRAAALITQIVAPPGHAWVLGADAYLAVARAQLAAGRATDAAASLRPLAVAVNRLDWRPLRAPVAALDAAIAAATGLQPSGRG
jgi:DNA-binding SARP family transcriptional activator/tetratricopeptide (TPR) repeat protein